MKNSKRKHQKRCNGKLRLTKKTSTYGLHECKKCGFKTRSYKSRRRDE